MISETEDKYIKGAPIFFGEMSYLFYYFLYQEGVDSNEMWVICFTQKYPDIDPDSLNQSRLNYLCFKQRVIKKDRKLL